MNKILLFLLMASSLLATPKAIVFDFNDVMTKDPEREKIYSFLHKTLHLSREEFEPVYEVILAGRCDKDYWRSLAKDKGMQISTAWRNNFRTIMNDAMARPEMFALINRLKEKHIRVVLFSNMDAISAQLFKEMGLFEPFDQCIFASQIGALKPDPIAYQILLQQLELPASDIVFIDDRPENVEAAAAMGIDAILFQSEAQIQRELQVIAIEPKTVFVETVQ